MAIKKENHSVQFLIRVTPTEYVEIKSNTDKAGLSMSEYARRILTGETIVAAPPADLNILIREVKRVGSNLHQVLHKLNVLGIAHPLELERCAEDIRDVLNLIYRTYRPGKGDD
jgi:hypothetical protein